MRDIREYERALRGFTRFITWYERSYLRRLRDAIGSVDHHVNRWERSYYKDVQREINEKSMGGIVGRLRRVRQLAEQALEEPRRASFTEMLAQMERINETFSFWATKLQVFESILLQRFQKQGHPVHQALDEVQRLLMEANYEGEPLREVLDHYLHRPSLFSLPGRHETGILLQLKQFAQLRSNKRLRRRVGGYNGWFRRFTRHTVWKAPITAANRHGHFRPSITFSLAYPLEYRTPYLQRLVQEQLNGDVRDHFYQGAFSDQRAIYERFRKLQAIWEFFLEDVPRFAELSLHFLEYTVKLAILKYPNRTITNDRILFDCLLRNGSFLGAICGGQSTSARYVAIAGLGHLLRDFSAYCLSYADRHDLFSEKQPVRLGIRPTPDPTPGSPAAPGNTPLIKNWDYYLNKPALAIDRKRLERGLRQEFDLPEGSLPKDLPREIDRQATTWAHELTHTYDLQRPEVLRELHEVYGAPATPRTVALVDFLGRMRAEAITRWRDSNMHIGGRQLEKEGISSLSTEMLDPHVGLPSVHRKLEILASPHPGPIPQFQHEYYTIGNFYVTLLGITRYLRGGGTYVYYLLDPAEEQRVHDETLRAGVGGMSDDEYRALMLDRVVRSHPLAAYQELAKEYRRRDRNALKDVRAFPGLLQTGEYAHIEAIKRQDPARANALLKLRRVALYHLQRLGILYWELQQSEGELREELRRNYEKERRSISQDDQIFNFITRSVEEQQEYLVAGQTLAYHSLRDRSFLEGLREQKRVRRVELRSGEERRLGKDLRSGIVAFTAFEEERLVDSVLEEVSRITSSREWLRLMGEMAHHYRLPEQFRFLSKKGEVEGLLHDVVELDMRSLTAQRLELTPEEEECFFGPVRKF